MTKNKESVFNQFTHKYALSKTLRFELRPIGKTADFLKENKVFEKDKLVDDNYHKIKYYFDALHREFINQTLQNVSFSVIEYQKYFQAVEQLKKVGKKDKRKETKNFQEIEESFRKKIVARFDKTAEQWKNQFFAKGIKFKQDGVEILFEEAILTALRAKFLNPPGDDHNAPVIVFTDSITGKEKNLFDSFKGFFTYFSNFNNTKRNLYSYEDKDTAVANRAINENLRKFSENICQFNEKERDYIQCELTKEEQKAFEIEFYNQCLAQDGIDKYNCLIGGFITETGEKIKGINEKINIYNQRHKDKKLRPFALLFKQILSKKDKEERLTEIKDDGEVFTILMEFNTLNDSKLKGAKELMDSFFQNHNKYNLERVYLKGSALNTISQKWFNSWSAIGNLLWADNEKKKPIEDDEKEVKLPDFISIAQLKKALESRSTVGTEEFIEGKDLFRVTYKGIYEKSNNHFETFMKIWIKEWQDRLGEYDVARRTTVAMIKKEKSYQRDNEGQIAMIKTYCQADLAIFQMIKYFALEKGRKKVVPDAGVDNEFYNSFNACYEDYPVPAFYNEFRNYLTKKAHLGRLFFPSLNNGYEQRHPFSRRNIDGAEKIKLNFENGSLLGGWSDSPEGNTQFCGFVFRKDDKYFLGISSDPKIFDSKRNEKIYQISKKDEICEKMVYKQIKSTSIYGSCYMGKYKTAYADDKEKLRDAELIDRIKLILKEKYLTDYPQLKKIISKNYVLAKDLAKDLNSLNLYFLKFVKINHQFLENLSCAENKEIFYLFEITNKDLKKEKRSKDNLHTLYFNALFNEANISVPVFKLSGGAEIFFRPKNEHLSRKKDNKGKEIIDHKRYGENKIFLHLPICLNFRSEIITNRSRKYYSQKFNGFINAMIANDKKQTVKIIGVDRGEKNLAYLALIDQRGKLLKCNDLNGKLPNKETYCQKLEARARKREEERKEWKTIENIKEIKNGYISWIVRYLADLMISENAVIVFEDLNLGFKRGRQKIEQQIYQKLELALVQKLNYLVDKNVLIETPGHYLNAYQLTPQVATPQDIGKQCGAVFFVSPGYTSLTCPECGYRKNISFNFENITKAREAIRKSDLSIAYKNRVFTISYKAFDEKSKCKGIYEIFSNVKRVRWHKKGTDYARTGLEGQGEKLLEDSKNGVVKEYDMTAVIKNFFDDNGIEYEKQALSTPKLIVSESADFYRRLFWTLNLLLRSRNSISGTDIDYIQCPRCLFHSDNGFQGQKYNGDANGAFNIARKGLLALRKIQEAREPESMRWGDFKIDINEWDKFVQSKWNPTSKFQK